MAPMTEARHVEPRQDARLGTWAFPFMLLLVGLGGGYLLSASGQVRAGQPVTVPQSPDYSALRQDVRKLQKQVVRLSTSNGSLRSQVRLLTEKNGVIDQVIAHLRRLKADNQAIVDFLKPANDPSHGPADRVLEGVRPDHQIVTPADGQRQAHKGEPAGGTPVPEPRPADRRNSQTGRTAGGQAG